MVRGFRNFLMQGELVVIAVGLVIALAFSTLIKSFTDSIITPLVNAAGGKGAANSGLGWTLNGQRIDLGSFISAIVYFVIHGGDLLRDRGALPGLHGSSWTDGVRRARADQDLSQLSLGRPAGRSQPV
jgi:hypothetical protein